MLFQVVIFIFISITSNTVKASLDTLTRKEGEDAVFMFNVSAVILEVLWGIQDDDAKVIELIKVDKISGVQIPYNADYAGRLSFVGNITRGQAWFKITNLNINDTNQYMARILIDVPGHGYIYNVTKLTVIQPVLPTVPSVTSSAPSSILTQPDPTNFPSTDPPILNNLTTSLKVVGDFSKDMLDSTSESFTNFTAEFKTAIERAYEVEQKFERTTVIRLRNGSINVTFIVFFKSGISPANACAPLEKAIKEDGKLGNFEIIPGSLECSKPNPSTPRPPASTTGVHPGIIAGVVIVGVLAIAGLVIAILFVCRKKSSKKAYRNSTEPGRGHEMDTRYGEPEEQYASVQTPGASVPQQSADQSLPQYAVVDKSKKNKNKPRESDELVYAVLDHDHNASMSSRPPSDRRSTGATGDTVYADIQSEKKKQRYPPPQYGNIQDNSYA